jgi:hypothetical protein
MDLVQAAPINMRIKRSDGKWLHGYQYNTDKPRWTQVKKAALRISTHTEAKLILAGLMYWFPDYRYEIDET